MPLELPLKKTDSLFNLLESTSSKAADNVDIVGSHRANVETVSQPSYFPITTFTVGNWKRESCRQGDLTAKFLYGKKKVVWEFLDGPLKSKIEVSWSDITAIEAVTNPNQPGFLRLELANPPFFFREIPPQPRKRSSWEPVHDFTGGQAQLCRYEATFPPGVLDKPYKTLLLHDARLAQLSRRLTSVNNEPAFGASSSQNPSSAFPASTFAGPSSSDHQNLDAVPHQQVYEHNDMAVPVIPPPSEAQYYMVQSGGEQSSAEWDIDFDWVI
ncbi:hypothetical protein AAHA92_12915 [Salvia divinorum]|uniref:TRF2/HOY1 PH-like domain-containing protein n=1 Tax=Salvia divinorum TaxID=28513 RepID=A0ABD1HAU6_SALDI